METIGILLMAYGGPDSLEEIEPYLLDVRGGRHTPAALVEEIRERYAAIGGRSPLREITENQAGELAAELNRRAIPGFRFESYIGMRHWTPRIHEAVGRMKAAGVRKAVALVMAPHYSRLSIEKYMEQVSQAAGGRESGLAIHAVLSWHNHPGFIQAIAEKAGQRFAEFGELHPYVLFTAHSLPSRILQEGDPYVDQLNETAQQVAQALGLQTGRWQFCFQSAGRTGEAWLGPQIGEVVPQLAQAGEHSLLVVPIGFVADHVEVLYDIDIEAVHIAQQHGARLKRSESLNASPALISALADLIADHITQLESQGT